MSVSLSKKQRLKYPQNHLRYVEGVSTEIIHALCEYWPWLEEYPDNKMEKVQKIIGGVLIKEVHDVEK